MESIKVINLYRVSTDRQGAEGDDIPVQKSECMAFAKKQGWTVVEEITEKISGYTTAIEDRDSLFRIRQLAQEGEINVVLSYMSDRLGRQTELAGFVNGLAMLGVKVFTVKEGEINGGGHGGNLMTYIKFWMAEGESMKTSERVKDSMKQMNEEGMYMGGVLPLGYKLEDTGEKYNSKKTKTMKKIVIEEDEANVVKLIFNLVVEKGYGAGRITKHLNEHGYTCRGKIFRHNSISRILRNTVYIGYKRFGMFERQVRNKKLKMNPKDEWKLQPFNPDLMIISEEVFKNVQNIIDSRSKKKDNSTPTTTVRQSAVLLSGLVVCDKCGHNLKTDWSQKSYTRKSDGVVTKSKVHRYQCHHSTNFKGHGKKQWGSKTIDNMVEEQVLKTLSMIKFEDLDTELNSFKDKHVENIKQELSNLQKLKKKAELGLENSKNEMKKLMTGDSFFSQEQIAEMMNNFSSELFNLAEKERTMTEQLSENDLTLSDIQQLKERFHNFEAIYNEAEFEQKKMLIGSVVKQVRLNDDKVMIHFKIGIQEAVDRSLQPKGLTIVDSKLTEGQLWFTESNLQGCAGATLGSGMVSATHHQNNFQKLNILNMKDLLKHKSIEFVVEVKAG